MTRRALRDDGRLSVAAFLGSALGMVAVVLIADVEIPDDGAAVKIMVGPGLLAGSLYAASKLFELRPSARLLAKAFPATVVGAAAGLLPLRHFHNPDLSFVEYVVHLGNCASLTPLAALNLLGMLFASGPGR